MPSLIDENTQYEDAGIPINNGYIYIGVKGQDPVLNPKSIFSDRDLTVALANPQRTGSDGRSANKIWTEGDYSIKIENSANVQKLQDLDAGQGSQTGISPLSNVQGTNTVTADAVVTITVLTDKQIYSFTNANANTGAMTLNINSIGAKAVVKNHDNALDSGDIKADQLAYVAYNLTGDVFEMLSDAAQTDAAIGTAVTTTSGTTASFSGIPSWVTQITISFIGVSMSLDTSDLWLRLGDSGGIETTGYDSDGRQALGSGSTVLTSSTSTTRFTIQEGVTGSNSGFNNGSSVLTLIDASTNTWGFNSSVVHSTKSIHWVVGSKPLSSTLTQIEVLCGSAGAFDAGQVNIRYS